MYAGWGGIACFQDVEEANGLRVSVRQNRDPKLFALVESWLAVVGFAAGHSAQDRSRHAERTDRQRTRPGARAASFSRS